MTLTVERITDGVIRIAMSGWRGRAVGYEASAYVVRDVLVDTGFAGACPEFLNAVQLLSPRGGIVTHSHEDHSGNAPPLAARSFPLYMHPECERVLRQVPPIGLYRRIVWGKAPPLTHSLVGFDPEPLKIIPTPGHTEDHLVVWDSERGIVASGDLFLGVKVRVAHVHESPALLVRSLRAVAALQPLMLLDAHRGVIHNPGAAIAAKIDFIETTVGEITQLAASGADEREIQHRVLGLEPLVGWVSFGEYSKRAFVKTVLRESRLPG